jgi:hypothetical protein
MAKSVPEPAASFKEIRDHALTANYRKFNVQPTEKNPQVWAAVMEIGYPQAVVTLICMIDGTVDLYFGNGGGITGGGAYESIRMKAEEFILTAQTALKQLSKTKHFPLPEVDRVRFFVRTFDAAYTTQANAQIDSENHDLFPLFRSGHEVIAAMRAVDEAGAKFNT